MRETKFALILFFSVPVLMSERNDDTDDEDIMKTERASRASNPFLSAAQEKFPSNI